MIKCFNYIRLHLCGISVAIWCLLGISSCIEPPLRLPAQEVMIDLPIVITDMKLVWNLEVDLEADWHYGWDKTDRELWGELEYPTPNSFEIRRYFLGETPRVPHSKPDAFIVHTNSFSRTYSFGYYDMLLWSLIETESQSQVVTIDESDYDNVTASTTVTRSLNLSRGDSNLPTALFNQPEVFYSAYPRDIFISRNFDDYDEYDEVKNVWIKRIKCNLQPLVYIYLVQVILLNNQDNRVQGISGDCAITAMSSGTSVNTGHTFNSPCVVYFNTRMKRDIMYNGKQADIIGGKLTTYGLCDMDGYTADGRAEYQGSRSELPNYLIFELKMSGGSTQQVTVDITKQCQSQCHGGIITVILDAQSIDNPHATPTPDGPSSIFNPTVEDYDQLQYEIPM